MKNAVKTLLKLLIPAGFRPALKTTFRKIFYFGSARQCPFCKSTFRKFLPFGWNYPILKEQKVVGAGYRLNSICPDCGSSDRERLLYLYLLHKSDIFTSPCRFLHVAPEKQLEKILCGSSNIRYLSADITSRDVMVQMDLTQIPLPDKSFDVIVCCHVLEHILDDCKAMAELYRVLKPGGWAILQVPIATALEKTVEDSSIISPRARGETFGQEDHVRLYGCDYVTRLAAAGFQVELFSWLDQPEDFGSSENRYCLIPDERLHLARRP